MSNERTCRAVFLTLVAGRKQKDALIAALYESGVKLVSTMYGRGTVKASYLQNALGLIPEENKVILTGLVPKEKSCAVLDMLAERFHFDRPNTGIAFTIPIETLLFSKREA